jgi:hypothetical protein
VLAVRKINVHCIAAHGPIYNEAVVMATQGRKNNNNESDNLSYISDVMWRSRWPAGGCWDIIF